MVLTFAVSFGLAVAFFSLSMLNRKAEKLQRISKDKIRHVRHKVKSLKSELNRLEEDSMKCDKIVDLVETDIDNESTKSK